MSLKAINAYKKDNLKHDVATADPHRLTLMLMQGALDKLAYAKGAISRGDLKGRSDNVSKATAIFINLKDTLDIEVGGEMAQNLDSLYEYIINQLTSIDADNGVGLIDEVIALFSLVYIISIKFHDRFYTFFPIW